MTIRRDEVLRYLGQRDGNPGPEMDRLIGEAVARCESLARPRRVFQSFAPVFDEATGVIRLPGAPLTLTGDGIRRHLAGAERVVVLAATIGAGIERAIASARLEGMTMALAMDAAATACVEAACDEASGEIAALAAKDGLFAGNRYSPGYGDLPLALQPEILGVLDTSRRIGLTCTDSLILLPRKSVTAFAGLFPAPKSCREHDCARCDMRESCRFRTPL